MTKECTLEIYTKKETKKGFAEVVSSRRGKRRHNRIVGEKQRQERGAYHAVEILWDTGNTVLTVMAKNTEYLPCSHKREQASHLLRSLSSLVDVLLSPARTDAGSNMKP